MHALRYLYMRAPGEIFQLAPDPNSSTTANSSCSTMRAPDVIPPGDWQSPIYQSAARPAGPPHIGESALSGMIRDRSLANEPFGANIRKEQNRSAARRFVEQQSNERPRFEP